MEKVHFGTSAAGFAVAVAARWYVEFGGHPEYKTLLLIVAIFGLLVGVGLAMPYLRRQR